MKTYITDFETWLLNESHLNKNYSTQDKEWEADARKFYSDGVDKAMNSKIFNMKAPFSFPFIITVTGWGDCLGYLKAWKINSIDEFKSFFKNDNFDEKVCPTFDSDYDNINDLVEQLSQDMFTDDYGNGVIVNIFKTMDEMKSKEKESRDSYGKKLRSDLDYEIEDGDYFPTHTLSSI